MAYRKCVVSNCQPQKTVSFHRIPLKGWLRDIWLKRLNLPETVHGRVCSQHFEPSDFVLKGNNTWWLKRNTFPKQVEVQVPKQVEVNVPKQVEVKAEIGYVEAMRPNQIIVKEEVEFTEVEYLEEEFLEEESLEEEFKEEEFKEEEFKEEEFKEEEFKEGNFKEGECIIYVGIGRPFTDPIDTIADYQMNCSVYTTFKYSIYDDHNYSKYAKRRASTVNDSMLYRERELQFNVKFRKRIFPDKIDIWKTWNTNTWNTWIN